MNPVNIPIPAPQRSLNLSNSGTSAVANGTLFISQVRDATGASGGTASGVYVSDEFSNPNARGLRLFVNTSGAATGTATVKLQNREIISGNWVDISGATITNDGTGSTKMFTVHPDLPTGAVSCQQHVGTRWRAVMTLANAPLTCSASADYLN